VHFSVSVCGHAVSPAAGTPLAQVHSVPISHVLVTLFSKYPSSHESGSTILGSHRFVTMLYNQPCGQADVAAAPTPVERRKRNDAAIDILVFVFEKRANILLKERLVDLGSVL
jgi:hypothetical protein